jgi:hypothetical protein
MGKKSSGNSYTSKGERPNVSMNNQIAAWKAGKNVMLTVPNKGGDAKKMPFVRVNAREFWGNPNSSYMMKTTAE